MSSIQKIINIFAFNIYKFILLDISNGEIGTLIRGALDW